MFYRCTGPSLTIFMAIIAVAILANFIVCGWFWLGARTLNGWLAIAFPESSSGGSVCDCRLTNAMIKSNKTIAWDFGLRVCINTDNYPDGDVYSPCGVTDALVHDISTLYFSSMWNAVHPPLDGTLSGPEMVGGMLLLWIIGAIFGGMAGGFSSVFAGDIRDIVLTALRIRTTKPAI